ncbi:MULTISPECIES: hypothetical protein [unclassified Mesorhizobium]|uniref:hypothetical protein n=1 Tax=unclassified Mesorhizobium TaxID=325217 RepID=UPI00112D4397|nr:MULTISPECIES: hypothetical protein [unclassified Mesorhizobium]TPK83456.1 hypothetical protein FJ548_18700 [Mesorhizobium sp. B2-4-17]TPL05302.1 hypothetical protein FJ938_15180 [Mesorhizobium sp. B2-4-14]
MNSERVAAVRFDRQALLLLCGLLAACNGGDWRANAISAAEDKMRVEVNDSSATFSHIQLTGDSSSGQTCGVVRAKAGSGWKNVRFIVYIDNTAGPYVEAGLGRQSMSRPDFDWAWQNDCLNEGYKS